MLRTIMVTATLAAGATAAPPASPSHAADTDVPFDTLGIVTDTTGINLYPPEILRVRDDSDIEPTREILATGYGPSFADQVVAEIGEIPSDRVVLIGAIDSSCTPASTAGLVRGKDGDLVMYAPGHVPEPIECFVAVLTVAVLLVDADDAPPGSTDHAELVAFGFAGYGQPLEHTAVELTSDESVLAEILPMDVDLPLLPPLDPDERRFAFVRPGCQNTTAELIVTPQFVDTRLDYDEPGMVINCAEAEFFLAVFDVPADMVRDRSLLVGASPT